MKILKKNSGMRSVAKLCLNSFWGKFGQRGNLPQTSIVKSYGDLCSLIHNPEKQVQNCIPAKEDVMYVSWVYKEDSTSPCTNVAIAAYTTAQARLKLFEYLHKLDRRVLYYDTNSVIFVSKRGEENE